MIELKRSNEMREVKRGNEGSLKEAYGERSAAVRKAIAGYMAHAPLIFATPSAPQSSDESGTDHQSGMRSDGEWVWSSAGTRMFEDGRIDIEPEFVVHVIERRTPPEELSERQLEDAIKYLLESGRS
jgi:hypothetical protein